MIGDGLHRLAHRMLRPDTRCTIVEPAIADLQHEASRGTLSRLRGYVGVCRALGAGLVGEIAGDCALTAQRAPFARMTVPVLSTALLALLFQGPFLWAIGSSPRPWHHEIVLLLLYAPMLVALAAPAVTLPVAAVLARAGHTGASRGALLISVAIAVTIVIICHRADVAIHPLRGDLQIASAFSVRDGATARSLWSVRDRYRTQLDRLRAGERGTHETSDRFLLFASNRHAALAFTCVTFALAGVTFASRSTPLLVLLAAIVSLAHVAMGLTFTRVLYVQAVTGWASAIWAPVALVFLVFAWIAVRVSGQEA